MKETIITVCLLFSHIILYAADPVLSKGKKQEGKSLQSTPSLLGINKQDIYQVRGLYFDASLGMSTIKNNNLSSDIWNQKSGFGYNCSAGYFHSVSPMVKIKLGIGVSSYNTLLVGNGELQSPVIKDIDDDIYIESLMIMNADYNANPMYLSIPLVLEFGNASINKIGYYINFGIEYSYMLNENSTTSGSYTTKGTYPLWGVTLEDVPELGFYTEKNLESGAYLKKTNFSIRGGAGITLPLSGIIIFKIGFAGYMGLKDIGNNKPKNPELSPITQQTYDFRSDYVYNPLAASKQSYTRHVGVEFGFYISKRVK